MLERLQIHLIILRDIFFSPLIHAGFAIFVTPPVAGIVHFDDSLDERPPAG